MDISWTWLGIVGIVLILSACILGFRKGFVKEVVSAFFMIISFLLVWVINPYVNTFVKEYTPVYTVIQEKCQDMVMEQTDNRKALDKEEQALFLDRYITRLKTVYRPRSDGTVLLAFPRLFMVAKRR